MSETRTSFFDFDATKMFADFRFRPVDVDAVWAAQRRNIEALTQANQLAVEGVQAVVRRQVEAARESFEDFSALVRDLSKPGSADERIAKNTEYAKQMIEKGITHSRELAVLATKAGSEAADVLHKRASEGLDELRALTCTQAKA